MGFILTQLTTRIIDRYNNEENRVTFMIKPVIDFKDTFEITGLEFKITIKF